MRKIFCGGVGAVALSLAVAGPVAGAPPHGLDCWNALDSSFSFSDCRGFFPGNNSGYGASWTLDYINNTWQPGDFTASSGVDYSGGSITGDFVLAVKGGDFFSLFYFENYDGSPLDLNQAMEGVAANHRGTALGLSHATRFGGRVSVPEPGMLLLLGTGLLGLGVTRRREDVA